MNPGPKQNCTVNIFLLSLVKSIDSTSSDGLGRLVNDSPMKKANCTVKKIPVGRKIHLCLYAAKDIPRNTELRFDYGLSDLPWRSNLGKLLKLL